MESHQFSGGIIKKVDSSIMRIVFTEDITVDLLKEIHVIREELFGEGNYCTLIDATKDFMAVSKEAQEYIAKNAVVNQYRIAEAILVKNFGQKLGVQMYIRIFKPERKTMVFYQEDKAIAWLKEQYDAFVKAGN